MSRFPIVVLFLLAIFSEGRRRNKGSRNSGRDFYKILNIKRSANERQIKKAYRKLSKQYHPDKNKDPGAEDIYKDIVAAYECLSDKEKREVYDRHGEEGLEDLQKQNQGGGGSPFDFFFGGNQRRQDSGQPKGPDVHIKMAVSLKTLYLGDIIEFDYIRAVMCSRWDECEIDDRECDGPGVRMVTRTIGPGFIQKMQSQDDRCVSRGKRYNPNCRACPDGPTVTDSTPLMLEIEAGMKHGDTIIFEEVADETIGHTPGNLIIELVAEKHSFLNRKGDDLNMRLNIPLVDALAGFSKTIQHVDGHDVVIEPNQIISCNSVVRIPGEGMPNRNNPNQKGDLIVRFNIDFPHHLTEKQKKSLRATL